MVSNAAAVVFAYILHPLNPSDGRKVKGPNESVSCVLDGVRGGGLAGMW
jgi:hypothetical protein